MNKNSIKEDIKNAEHFIKSIKTDKEYKEENGWHGYYNKEIVELARMLEHILSDYKRVLKENEILKEEKARAWEEWNNLEQGSYETEQRLKQQIKELQKENEELKNDYENLSNSVVVKNYYIKNSIPIQKIKNKMKKEIKTNEHIILGGRRNGKTLEYGKRLGKIEMCQELLEGEQS